MSNYLPTDYQSFIHKSRYAKYFDGKGRENWGETVERYMDNVVRKVAGSDTYINEIRDAIVGLEIMPSMRAMMTAGPALERDNTAGYNCSYLPVDDPKSFDEAMFILLCGTGVGFSVERQFVQKLPEVPELFVSDTTIVVKDSKEGWAKAFRQLLALLWAGEIPKWDVSQVRPAGARLKTFGGRASGPAPLVELFNFSVQTFKNAQGRRLTSMECHDLMCFIGQIVVVGGVRRSAMISLSNLSDDRMRHAKSGQWWETAAHRALANNSVSYTEKPDIETFMREWLSLVESKSGERGVFNREASKKQAAKYGRRDPEHEFGTNPCSEIILRPYQFCNLTEVVVRATDTYDSLARKGQVGNDSWHYSVFLHQVPISAKSVATKYRRRTIVGCVAHRNNGQPLMTMKNKGLESTLAKLREVAVETNAEWAERLKINASVAINVLNHQALCRSLWTQPVVFMQDIPPTTYVLYVVITKTHSHSL